MPRYGTVDREYGMRLATCEPDADGPVYMLNLMKYRDRADYGDGRGGDISGRAADDRYAPIDVLDAIGARVVFVGDVLHATEDWDRVGVVRYPTRRSFIEMQSRRDFQDKHVHKEAGMDHTIVVGTLPGGPLPASGERVLVELWTGAEPPVLAEGTAARFSVEGTIIGDGRRWDGARYTVLDGDTSLPTSDAGHQALVVSATIQAWT